MNDATKDHLADFETWLLGRPIRERAIHHLRHYHLYQEDLPGDIVAYVRGLQAGRPGGGVPPVPPEATDIEWSQALDDLLIAKSSRDGLDRVRWKVVAAILDSTRGTLEVAWHRVIKSYQPHHMEDQHHA